jgi:hypothetical protein
MAEDKENKNTRRSDEQPATDRKSRQLNDEDLEKIAGGATRCGKCGAFYDGSHSCD